MDEPYTRDMKQIYIQLDNALQFRLSNLLQKSMAEKKLSTTLNAYIISQRSIILTRLCLFCQELAVLFFFSHSPLSLVHLFGKQVPGLV